MKEPEQRVVVTDANVLINLMHVARLDLCAGLTGYQFVVPDHVQDEIKDATQRRLLDDAIARGAFRIESITAIDSILLFNTLTERVEQGEAACLTLAIERGWMVASDEKKRFRREAEQRIGIERIIGTKELYLLAISAGLITVEEADSDKAALEQRRFKMDFASFRNLV